MTPVVDNTVLSNLAFADGVVILHRLFGRVLVPVEVREELLRGIEEGYRELARAEGEIGLGERCWLYLRALASEDEEHLFRRLSATLGLGEAACLAIASETAGLVLTDDRRARRACDRLGIRYSGSLGILRLAVERGLITIDEGNAMLAAMVRHRYRSPIRDLRELDSP